MRVVRVQTVLVVRVQTACFLRVQAACFVRVQIFPGLAVADAAHGGQVGVQVGARAQRPHLVEQAAGQHGVKALRYALVQPAALERLERNQQALMLRQIAALASRLAAVKRGQGTAGEPPDFERAPDALRIKGLQPRGRDRIAARELGVQRRPSLPARLRLQRGAHGRIGLGHGVQAVDQGLEIEHGAADQQGQAAARRDGGDQRLRVAGKLGGAVGLQRVADVDQVVRHGGAFCGRGFGRADVHAAIDQRRVDADDLDPVLLRNRHRGGRLARGRGAGQGDVAQRTLSAHRASPAAAPASTPPARPRRSRTRCRRPAGRRCRPCGCPASCRSGRPPSSSGNR